MNHQINLIDVKNKLESAHSELMETLSEPEKIQLSYLNLDPYFTFKSVKGRGGKCSTDKLPLLKRIVNLLMITKVNGGKRDKAQNILFEALASVENRTQKNPFLILIKSILNTLPYAGCRNIKYGAGYLTKSVVLTPRKGLSKCLKWIFHRHKRVNKSGSLTLAQEILSASENKSDSFAVGKCRESIKQYLGANI